MAHFPSVALCALTALTFLSCAASGQDLAFEGFAFQIPYDGLAEGSAPALLANFERPAGAEGFVQVKDHRFVLSDTGRPIRFWATNLSIGGCFPPHDVAERMARRMATLGINCVRLHFIDAAGYPSGIWDARGWGDIAHTTFRPEALDRLDYLVAQLKRHGIYTNINLHVARTYGPADGFPPLGEGESVPRLGKGIGLFYPRCIEEQERYARMLMRHVNSYTGNAYAEEPAVAMVEISNEDGLLSTYFGGFGSLDHLPEPYFEEIKNQWNEWLQRKYTSTDELRAAWVDGKVAGGTVNLLLAPGVAPYLQVAEQAEADLAESTSPDGRPIRTVTVRKPSSESWHAQLLWRPLTIEAGTTYVLKLRLRANRPANVSVGCMMDHDPWSSLGLYELVTVTSQWQDYAFYFRATGSDAPDEEGRGGARISLSNLPQENLQISVAEASLRAAAIHGILPDEQLGTVSWVRKRDWAQRTEALRLDVLLFLRETEAAYWRGMCEFLHDELGVKMPVTGTAVGNTPPHVAAETVDFLDSHAYWQHPHFPGRPWDRDNWIVRNLPMVNDPAGSTIARLAPRRVFGLPYTVSEYNHPAPSEYRAEGFPLIAVYGSFQDWDGVFTYTYAHGDWEKDHFASFFDIKADPVNLAVQPACSDILRNGRVEPPPGVAPMSLSLDERLRLMLDRRLPAFGRLAWQDALTGFATRKSPVAPPGRGSDVHWEADDGGHGLVTFRGRGCGGMIGFAEGKTLTAGPLLITAGPTSLDGFAVVLVNSVAGQELGEDGRYLITAVSRCANRGMGWNEARNSVGRQWGSGPSLCEGVPLTLKFRDEGRDVKVFRLNPDGTRRQEIPAYGTPDGTPRFELRPRHRTLWYELVVGG